MRRVFCIGETVLDIIFEEGQPKRANAGGSVLNSAVSLSRASCEAFLVSELGKDKTSGIILDFLKVNAVHTEHIYFNPIGKTPLALAFLDEKKEASYEFYKDFPLDRFHPTLPQFNEDDIILFGSTFSALPEVRPQLEAILSAAEAAACIIVFDPNVRKPFINKESYDYFRKNLSYADIVRASAPDFAALGLPVEPYEELKEHCRHLIVTNGEKGAILFTPKLKQSFSVIPCEPLSTIGAGDAFNAGLIAGIIRKNIHKKDIPQLSENDWKEIIGLALKFAKETVLSLDNYIPKDKNL